MYNHDFEITIHANDTDTHKVSTVLLADIIEDAIQNGIIEWDVDSFVHEASIRLATMCTNGELNLEQVCDVGRDIMFQLTRKR